MSYRWKRLAVGSLLGAVALWPLAHHAAVRLWHLDPWRFFGWAMYAAPTPYIELHFVERVEGQFRVLQLPQELRAQAAAYANARVRWGELYPPHALARAIARHRPQADGLAIVVRRYVLDRATSRFRYEDRQYSYRLAGGDAIPIPTVGPPQAPG